MHDMELSTQIIIAEAKKRGYSVHILDKPANFIHVSGKNRSEYIKQATKTRLDSYISMLIMENKQVSKEVMKQAEIAVPLGDKYDSIESFIRAYSEWSGKAIVIKPNSTNFGKGITVFANPVSQDEYEQAGKNAFLHDNSVIVEEYITGKEYRLLVIGNKVRAVLHRVPANVVGDGVSSISDLVAQKNRDPKRGTNYVKPLEKIKLDLIEQQFLADQGISFSSVPKLNQQVFLRENSNISTGGDSIDMTDQIHHEYCNIAVKAAQAVGASICGVDMIIPSLSDFRPDYAIIEVNFNPALHIHNYPAVGTNRRVERYVLDELALK